MPDPIAHYLDRLLQRRLEYELNRMEDVHTEWVDHEHDAVKQAQRQLRETFKSHGRIPQSEWDNALRGAVQRVMAYLIQPTKSLSNFVFGDHDDTLPVHTVKQRMRFFAPYPYLRDAVDTLVEEEGISSISRERFSAVLRRTEQDVAQEFDPEDWIELLEPLFDLIDTADPDQGVPVSFLHMFFEAKEADRIAQRLKEVSVEAGTTALEREDLREIIATVQSPSESFSSQEIDIPKPEPLAPTSPSDSADSSDLEDSSSAATTDRNNTAPGSDGSAAPDTLEADEKTPADEDTSEKKSSSETPSNRDPQPSEERPAKNGPESPAEKEAAPSDASSDDAIEDGSEEAPASEEASAPEPAPKSSEEEKRETHEHEEPAEEEQDDEPQPLWQRFQRSMSNSTSNNPTPPESSNEKRAAKLEDRSDASSGPLWTRFQPTKSSPETGDNLTTLEREVLGPKAEKRELFIQELFGGSREDYRHVLNRLQDAPDWSRASQIIAEDVFRAHKVNIYSEPAVAFTDAVEARYQNE